MDENQSRAESEVMIHVRFAPDGAVSEISGRPAQLTPQAWFNALSTNCGNSFRALTGGRGTFAIAADKLSELQNTVSGQQPN